MSELWRYFELLVFSSYNFFRYSACSSCSSINFFFIKEVKSETNKNIRFIIFLSWITCTYLIGMLLSRAGMKIDAERFLAIIYPFLCILIGFVLEKIKMNNFLKYGIAFSWLVYPLLRTLKNIIFWN
ncbi:hypothetical protein ACE193_13755 [Bernardetia sp. OM2101]|uniref:hypothetical protein n=1 Tax=Bernardetia sp. OM2101 TaxID=3344876 RepID=UPI0035CEBDDF